MCIKTEETERLHKKRSVWDQSQFRKRAAVYLATALLVALLAGCGSVAEPVPSEPPEEVPLPVATVFLNPLIPPDGSELIHDLPNLLPKISISDAINSDTVAWLQVPNTNIDEVVVYYDDSAAAKRNDYYLRRNLDKKYSFDGIFFGDYRTTFDGTAEGLSRNTVIYGHSFTDDYTGRLMNQLKKYDHRLNPDGEQFARDNPYIFFSTEKENLAWEIFAVFDATIALPYNRPKQNDEEFSTTLSEALKRSIYQYDTEVTAQDKIITLSTCTYKYDKKYPNNYRYVVMAKLVDQTTPLKQHANLQLVTAPKAP